MATIDQLDLSVYSNYALRITLIEQINSQLRLSEASSIPPQLSVVDIYPKLTELDLVLGVIPLATPWAYFYPPQHFRDLRRNPFAFFRIAPTFGSLDKQDEEEAEVEAIEVDNPEDVKNKAAIKGCLKQMRKINEMINYIVGRVGQFLQG